MTVFVDTSAWFAAANTRDRHHERASKLVREHIPLTTSTFVLVETWLLLQNKIAFAVADAFAEYVCLGAARLEQTTLEDLEHAQQISLTFPDQSFSLVDRTSFAIMERLGMSKVIAFDSDFLIYRFGLDRRSAFEVLR